MSETSIVFALVILCVVLICTHYYEMCCENAVSLMWESRDTYLDLLEKFGIPDIVDPDKGGGAIWNVAPHRITLFDEKTFSGVAEKSQKSTQGMSKIHITTPIKLFAGINPKIVKVSDQGRQRRIAEIIGILPKYISYDPVAETITTQFYNVDVAFYLTMLCMKITTGELNQNDARTLLADSLGKNKPFDVYSDYINRYVEYVF